MTERWALCAYPLSAAYLSNLRTHFGADLQPAVLSEMRRSTIWSMLAALRRVRAAEGLVLLEDTGATPLQPVLQFLLSLTRCRTLAVIDGNFDRTPFTRARAYCEAPALVGATLAGLWSALLCWFELKRLASAAPAGCRGSVLRSVCVLRTNLWFGLKAGGSVGHTAGVINALARTCERVDVLSPDTLPLVQAPTSVTIVPPPRRYGYPYELNYYAYHRRFVRDALTLLAHHRPDFLYHRISLGGYAGVSVARRLRLPLVLEYNGSEVWVSQHWGTALRFPQLARMAEDVPLALADVITTVSEVLGEELRHRGVPVERIVVHPNGVDPRMFDPDRYTVEERQTLRRELGLATDDVVCTFVGTFGRWHGVTLLAGVIRSMIEEDEAWLSGRRVRFLFVGDGLYMTEVRRILDTALSRGYAILTGLVPQRDAPRYLAISDILLSPHVPNPDGSRFFGSPTKLFEYMAMTRAIIASDLEQIGQILQPAIRTGNALDGTVMPDAVALLTRPGSAEDLREAIRFLVARADVRKQLGTNARARVLSAYTWEHNVRAVMQRLHAVCG
jgi:glycosyltransferase involved in cell wall biosynthesis